MNVNDYQNEFNKIIARKYFPSRLNSTRQKAFSKFLDIGLPTKKWEDWRHTDLSFLNKNNFRISEANDASENIDFSKYKIKNTHTLVIINGHYVEHLSDAPKELKVLTNYEYLEQNDWKQKDKKDTPFDLLNTSLCDSGMSFIIEPNTNIDKPIHILFICSGSENLIISPQVNIDISRSSSATVIEQYASETSSFFQNNCVFASLKENASLNHLRIFSNANKTINISSSYIEQSDNSNYRYFQFVDSGALQRSDIYNSLKGINSTCFLSGLTLLDDDKQSATYITTDHIMPNCTSSQNFKSVLNNKSSGVFNGRTIVREDSQKTNSKQSNKNLLLSDKATMNSNPQLEIYADDVKCAHGSTTGALDNEALFYMQSRGLDRESASSLLIRGFVIELMEEIENKDLRDYLFNKFGNWLIKNNK
jgi:Fe-S cluster assembly protein SufD